MKFSKYSLLLIALVFVPMNAFSQSNAEMVLEQAQIDLGEVLFTSGLIEREIHFKNTGSESLVISRQIDNCTCINVEWFKDSIMPGQASSFKFSFDPSSLVGEFSKEITFFTNAKHSPTVFHVKGKVSRLKEHKSLTHKIGDLGVEVRQVNFGYLYKGDIGTKTIQLSNYSDKDIELELEDLPEHIDVFLKPSVIPAGSHALMEVNFYTTKTDKWDFILDRVGFHVKGDKHIQGVVSITANIREKFLALEAYDTLPKPVADFAELSYDFGRISNSDKIEHKFKVQNQGDEDLVIRSVIASCGCTAANPEVNVIPPGQSGFISASFDAKGFSGDIRKSITVITNDPHNYKLFLWLEGIVE